MAARLDTGTIVVAILFSIVWLAGGTWLFVRVWRRRMRRPDIEVGGLYVVRRSSFGERLWKLGWWAAHVPSGYLQLLIQVFTFGVISPQKGTEPPSGTILQAERTTKVLGVTFVDATTGEHVTISSQLVVPFEEPGEETQQ